MQFLLLSIMEIRIQLLLWWVGSLVLSVEQLWSSSGYVNLKSTTWIVVKWALREDFLPNCFPQILQWWFKLVKIRVKDKKNINGVSAEADFWQIDIVKLDFWIDPCWWALTNSAIAEGIFRDWQTEELSSILLIGDTRDKKTEENIFKKKSGISMQYDQKDILVLMTKKMRMKSKTFERCVYLASGPLDKCNQILHIYQDYSLKIQTYRSACIK